MLQLSRETIGISSLSTLTHIKVTFLFHSLNGLIVANVMRTIPVSSAELTIFEITFGETNK